MTERVHDILERWQSQGLIEKDQVTAILEYEGARSKGHGLINGFLLLGVSVALIGVIALISYNWKEIPDGLKLGMDFLLMGLAAALSYRFRRKEKWALFEAGLVVLILLCLASVGLISQIFHTGGKLYEALFFVLMVTGPALLFSKNLYPNLLWTLGLWLALTSYFEERATFTLGSWVVEPIFWGQCMPLFFAFFALTLYRFTPFRKMALAWQWVAHLGLILIGLFYDTIFGLRRILFDGSDRHHPWFGVILTLCLLGASLLILYGWDRLTKGEKRALALLGGCYPLFLTLPYWLGDSPFIESFLGLILFTGIFGVLASFGIKYEKRGIFYFSVLLIGFKAFAFFLAASGGLLVTGLGLIGIGGFMVAVSLFYQRRKERLKTWVTQWM